MKKKLPFFLLMFAATSFTFAQTVVFSDNFDSYTTGSKLAESNPAWTTWGGVTGGANDGVISDQQASSATNSLYISDNTDQIFLFGELGTGHYKVTFNMFVPTGGAAYFNVLHLYGSHNNCWAFECYLKTNGTGYMTLEGTNHDFSYPVNTWFPVEMDFDLDQDLATLTIDYSEVNTWPFHKGGRNTSTADSVNILDALNFYASTVGNVASKFFVDDFVFSAFCGEFSVSDQSITLSTAPDSVVSHTITLGNAGDFATDWQTIVTYDIPNPDTTSTDPVTLTYCPNTINHIDSYTSSSHIDLATGFPSSTLQSHIGKALRAISIFLPEGMTNAKIMVYGMNHQIVSSCGPGDVIYEQSFVPVEGWNYVPLDNFVVIDGSDLWIGIQIDQDDFVLWPIVKVEPTQQEGYSLWSKYGNYPWENENLLSVLTPNPQMEKTLPIKCHIDGTPINRWLTVSPEEGTVGAGESVSQVITVNANGTQVGDVYTAKLHIFSSSFINGNKIVPVSMEITNVSVNEHNQIEVSVYPNPATDHLQIVSDEIQRVEVYNLMGQCVFSQNYGDTHVIIPTSGMAPGTYAVNVITRNDRVTKKVMIR